jgi:hypothetical protein
MMGMMQLIDIDIAVAVADAVAVVFDCKNVFILIAICLNGVGLKKNVFFGFVLVHLPILSCFSGSGIML